jgi:osmotically-inducible protein OsmY
MIREARADEDVKLDVAEHLAWDDRVDASDVKTQVVEGVVTLEGSVPSRRSLRVAESDALGVRGVLSVDNRLTVKPPEGLALPTDSMISDDVHYLIRLYPEINIADLKVAVIGGVVRLQGSVDSYWKKTWLEELAEGVTGVQTVRNELSVVPSDDMVDKAIAERIESALARSARVDATNVTLNVEEGNVHVFGSVRNHGAREAVLEACGYTRGVRHVESHLGIG